MSKILITGMAIEKNRIVIKEAKHVDNSGKPTRAVAINEAFAIALKASIIELDLEHLKEDY